MELKGCPAVRSGTLSYTNGCTGTRSNPQTAERPSDSREQKAIAEYRRAEREFAALTGKGWVFVSSLMDI